MDVSQPQKDSQVSCKHPVSGGGYSPAPHKAREEREIQETEPGISAAEGDVRLKSDEQLDWEPLVSVLRS